MTARVMLVEDHPAVQSTLGDLMRSTGDFDVVASLATEAEALDWICQHPSEWDLGVVDLVLDQGNGFGVIERARALSPTARIVVLTAFASGGMREHCKHLGADAVFDKANLPSFLGYCGRYSPKGDVQRA